MATIAICVYPLAGPINATRKLARDLRARGHTVHYLGLASCQPYLGGESFFPVFSSVFPAPPADGGPPRRVSRIERLRGARAVSGRGRALVKGLIEGRYAGFDTLMDALRPDLMVIVSTTFYVFLWGLLAHRFHIPCVMLNDCLTGPVSAQIPPISSTLQPRQGWIGRRRIWLAWRRLAASRWLRARFGRLMTGWDVAALARTLARGFEFPAHLMEEHEALYLRPKAPEIVLMPERFDFPHEPRPDRCYSSCSVDLSRHEAPFPWDRLDPGLPLIYCTLGTTDALRPDEYGRFFRCLLEAFRPFSDRYQLVLATCDHVPLASLGRLPPHVVVVSHAPQIALLRRAALMVTHGGSNTVRECLTLAVPMLLYPHGFDQFGLAARAVYHGVGLQGSLRGATAATIGGQLEQLLTHTHYRLQSLRMSRDARAAEATCSPALCVEMFLPDVVADPPRAAASATQMAART